MSGTRLRGLARRILVIAPKGLVTQWIAEMQTHPMYEAFNRCTRLFDTYFYGQRLLDESSFIRIQSEFKTLLEQSKPIERELIK